jgi:outer membrane protein TolC
LRATNAISTLPEVCHVVSEQVYLRLFMLLGASLLVTSCAMVGPDFQKPEADVTEAWSEVDEPEINTESIDYREWWKNFNDPVLDTLIQTAYDQSLTLQIAGLRVYEARAILGVAAGTLYPQAQSARASATAFQLSENADPIANLPPAVGSLVDPSFNRYGMSLDAAWELDFWGRFRRGVESADANLAASIATYDDILVTLTGGGHRLRAAENP